MNEQEKALTLPGAIDMIPAAYNIADAKIDEMRQRFLPMRIVSNDDAKQVHAARMVVKNTRVAIEKKRKELKADALTYGNAVDAEAKRLTALLSPIEEHLEREQTEHEAKLEKIKQAAEEARRAKLQARVEQLRAVGSQALPMDVEPMSDEKFAEVLATTTAQWNEAQAQKAIEEERARVAEAERRALEESERVRREAEAAEARAELARQQEALRIETERAQAALRAQQERIDAENAKRRQEEDDRLEAERIKLADERRAIESERARQEQVQRAEREKVEAEDRAKRIAAARPTVEKIQAFAAQLEAVPVPDVPQSGELRAAVGTAVAEINVILFGLRG